MQDVEFKVEGQKLRGKLFYPENLKDKNPAVLLIHGWNTTQSRMMLPAEELAKAGYISMTFDLRGHGESDGNIENVSREDHLEDVVAAYNFLCQQNNVDETKIFIVGSSYGSYLAALFTGLKPIAGIAMRVPALIYDEEFDRPTKEIFADQMMKTYKNTLHTAQDNVVLRDLSNFSGKVLIVESEKDEQIPHQTIQNYIDAIKDKEKLTHIVMKDTAHSLGTDEKRQEFAEILRDWFSKLKDISFAF